MADVDGFVGSATALRVLEARYLGKDEKGEVIETSDELFRRVAKAVASVGPEEAIGPSLEDEFYMMMTRKDFLPNSPTLMNAGTPVGQLSACFVLPIEDSIESIFEQSRRMAIIFKSGGGVGLSFSRLRPAGDMVMSTRGKSSGPISFMHVYDMTAEVVKQGGRRRGAMMGSLHVNHPDIMAFIKAKEDLKSLTNMNTSVCVTTEFMDALKVEGSFQLINPRNGDVVESLKASEVFDAVVERAWRTGEPGLIFIDRINQGNPILGQGEIETTNPCGEQPLLPNESCNLGSINLSNMVKDGQFEGERLDYVVRLAVNFLDNVIEVNVFPFPEIEENTKRNRKIGLGVMGFAECLVKLGVQYDSNVAVKWADRIMSRIAVVAREESERLAELRGPFPAFENSRCSSGKPIRNSTRTTIAPTGSISIIADVTGAIEPMFSVGLKRQGILDNETFYDVNPVFKEIAEREGFWSEDIARQVSTVASIQEIEAIPEDVRRLFRTAHDVPPEWHIKMQAAFQKYVDNAVSKTLNLPSDATVDDVRRAFLTAYETGCKGVTVYRDGARENQPMTTESKVETTADGFRRPGGRPKMLPGNTWKMKTGCGNLFITITRRDGKVQELFAKHGKAGVCSQVQCEAIGRLASLALRSDVDPEEVMIQLAGITCHAPFGFGRDRVLSCADAVAQALNLEVKGEARDGDKIADELQQAHAAGHEDAPKSEPRLVLRFGACPDCGAALAREANCRVCRTCGFSMC